MLQLIIYKSCCAVTDPTNCAVVGNDLRDVLTPGAGTGYTIYAYNSNVKSETRV